MDLKIKNKKALVMGASAGLGRGIAEALIQEGVDVAICARTEATLNKAQKEMGAKKAYPCDLTQRHAARKLTESASKDLDGLDILVINAGGPPKGGFEQVTEDQWREGFESLWMSTVDSIKVALPLMKKNKWGRILIVTSVAAKEPIPNLTVSNGLRAGLLGLVRSISHEVAADGITINALLPGYTQTERLTELGVDISQMTQKIPARRLGTTKEFGALAAFLASDLAGYITGQMISADGGSTKGI